MVSKKHIVIILIVLLFSLTLIGCNPFSSDDEVEITIEAESYRISNVKIGDTFLGDRIVNSPATTTVEPGSHRVSWIYDSLVWGETGYSDTINVSESRNSFLIKRDHDGNIIGN